MEPSCVHRSHVYVSFMFQTRSGQLTNNNQSKRLKLQAAAKAGLGSWYLRETQNPLHSATSTILQCRPGKLSSRPAPTNNYSWSLLPTQKRPALHGYRHQTGLRLRRRVAGKHHEIAVTTHPLSRLTMPNLPLSQGHWLVSSIKRPSFFAKIRKGAAI